MTDASPTARVLLAHSEQLICHALAALIRGRPGLGISGLCTEARVIPARVQGLRPDVLLLDSLLVQDAPPLPSLGVPTVILSRQEDPASLRDALQDGAVAVVTTSASAHRLGAALQGGASGGGGLAIYAGVRSGEAGDLSSREREVLALVAMGHTSASAARLLGVKAKTVDTYRERLRRKLAATHRVDLVQAARDLGLM